MTKVLDQTIIKKIKTDSLLFPMQGVLFDIPEIETKITTIRIKEYHNIDFSFFGVNLNDKFNLNNRRYIGNKFKLTNWIFGIIKEKCVGESFADVFAGTGIVGAFASQYFDKIIVNDFLDSNHTIYQAFFSNNPYNQEKIDSIIYNYNSLNSDLLEENYFSENFGGKYFSQNSAKKIGYIREDIEKNKSNLTQKEYYILIASLLYSIDKIANTVGHYDAFFKKTKINDNFIMKSIETIKMKDVSIFNQDTNILAKNLKADIVYIDPPYNSRQYSRFYHVLENLTKWQKPKLYGTALKPEPEKISEYCKISAKYKFAELVNDLQAKYLVVSYNNTYTSKSNSSKNKMTLEEIKAILETKGKTEIFEQDYKCFNAGNTDFDNHKEYLFVTKVNGG
ncbi:MAG: DNA adenine methylase [Candidatus Gracilibacteria bacterium]|nr:DNA adenine methylase [Candidatus Gracilibacteria bacterium]